uniref:SCY domain-containing protein n=1 Tax=Bursaphelenchus xylophilus TaxID=6326 RepID=A0A1I7SPX1_BURXY
MWSSLGAVISVVFVFATSIDQVHSLRCYEEEGVPLNIRPFEYSIAGSRPTACCVELFLNGIVNYVSVEMHDKKKWFGGAHENFCQLQAKKHRFVW